MSGEADLGGARLVRGALCASRQAELVAEVGRIAAAAPFFHPETRWGKPMSVRMTSAGRVGWVSDRRGYRYAPAHPDGRPWPEVPPAFLAVWEEFARCARLPDTCLVNHYAGTARMGLHQDRDEADLGLPVLSVSLGDDALFRIGGSERGGPTRSVWLASGDIVVLEGRGRLAHHGIDRVRPGTSDLVPWGGRINLTMRVAG